MDVGISGRPDTCEDLEKSDYSFAIFDCNVLEEENEETFPYLCDKIREYKKKPLFWKFGKNDITEYDEDGGYLKDYFINLFFRIDVLGGEYVIIKHSPETMKKNPQKYSECLLGISALAISYGLEIVLLFEGGDQEILTEYDKAKLFAEEHPFLRYGFDMSSVTDIQDFFDCISDTDNVLYYNMDINQNSETKLKVLTDILADTDTYLSLDNIKSKSELPPKPRLRNF